MQEVNIPQDNFSNQEESGINNNVEYSMDYSYYDCLHSPVPDRNDFFEDPSFK